MTKKFTKVFSLSLLTLILGLVGCGKKENKSAQVYQTVPIEIFNRFINSTNGQRLADRITACDRNGREFELILDSNRTFQIYGGVGAQEYGHYDVAPQGTLTFQSHVSNRMLGVGTLYGQAGVYGQYGQYGGQYGQYGNGYQYPRNQYPNNGYGYGNGNGYGYGNGYCSTAQTNDCLTITFYYENYLTEEKNLTFCLEFQ